MNKWFALSLSSLTLIATPIAAKAPIPAAIYTDPIRDAKHPARMDVLHIPSGGVAINGIVYVAAGPGTHPTLVIFHGLPGNEKNLDLAQAVRRAGWNAVTFNYRGSWGSPGRFSFAGNVADGAAVLAYLRDPANAKKLGIDPSRIALAGHSMGGWVAAMVAEQDPKVMGTALISAANMGGLDVTPAEAPAFMADNMESLATTAQAMADEIEHDKATLNWTPQSAGLARRPLLIMSSDDGLAPGTDALGRLVRSSKGSQVTTVHVATDHGWSDRRIRLQTQVIRWLATLPPVPQ